MRLKDRVAIVTGGGSGFGAGIVCKFVAEGAKVLVVDRDAQAARHVAEQAGPFAAAHAADVSRAADTLAMVDAAEAKFGPLDILVNNAGVSHLPASTEEVSEVDFDRIVAVNMKAIYLATQVVAMRLVLASGEVLVVGPEQNAELLPALRVSLGALGIVTQVTLRVVPTFYLHEEREPLPFGEVLPQLPALIPSADHFKLWWFPHAPVMQLYRQHRTQQPAQLQAAQLDTLRVRRIGAADGHHHRTAQAQVAHLDRHAIVQCIDGQAAAAAESRRVACSVQIQGLRQRQVFVDCRERIDDQFIARDGSVDARLQRGRARCRRPGPQCRLGRSGQQPQQRHQQRPAHDPAPGSSRSRQRSVGAALRPLTAVKPKRCRIG